VELPGSSSDPETATLRPTYRNYEVVAGLIVDRIAERIFAGFPQISMRSTIPHDRLNMQKGMGLLAAFVGLATVFGARPQGP
jgi:hypothetical protein